MKKICCEMTDSEYALLMDIVNHANFDVEESKIYWDMRTKLIR